MTSVFRTADLIEQVGRARVRRELAHGRWTRRAHGVIVVHNGPLSHREQIEVALAASAPGSAVAGRTALELDGMRFIDTPGPPTIVLPEGAKPPRDVALTVHWSTKLDARDVHPTRQPRRTRSARSVVDQASWSPTDRGARVVVLAAVQQGVIRPRDVREALTRRGACRWRALIVESVLDAYGGIQSLPERDFANICRSHRVPTPRRQSLRRRPDGRCYLDAEWPQFDAACEIHGIPHLAVTTWDSDLDRANDIVATGPRLLTFSSFAVRRRQGDVARQLTALLRRGGWQG